MVNGDFMSVLFRDILRMTQYPGAPFSGDVLQDLVNFFLFPTVFLILFIYVIIGVLFTRAQPKFRLLVGITLYLVIIVNGWFSTFALLGQFYILLLIALGVVYFVLAHFGIRIGGAVPGGAAPGASSEARREFKVIKSRRERIENELEALEARLAAAKQKGDFEEAERIQRKIIEKRDELHRLF
jgi:hypothetical protein